jgi:crotonobetainyl-CoA:carnitine CoA-transferase CaiB-like acyl-CoA transferase
VPGRNGSRLAFSSPRNVYRSRDGEYFAVSGTAPSAAETVIHLIGGDELLADTRFSTHEARALHAEELDQIVAAWIAERDIAEVDSLFADAGAAGIRVLSIADVFADPHYAARETFVDVEDDELGRVTLAAPVPRMSDTPARVAHAGPPLGRDTDSVLEELGYTREEISAGRDEGAW